MPGCLKRAGLFQLHFFFFLDRYEVLENSHHSACVFIQQSKTMNQRTVRHKIYIIFNSFFYALSTFLSSSKSRIRSWDVLQRCFIAHSSFLSTLCSCLILIVFNSSRRPCTLTFPFLHYSFVFQPQSYEAVEPLDLEEFLMSQLRSGDSAVMQELGDFPDDDLKVEQVEKECRTVRHSVPDDGWVSALQTLDSKKNMRLLV